MTAGDTFTRKNALQVLDGLIYYLFISFCLIKRDIGATVRVRYPPKFWRVRGRRVG